MEPSDLLDQYLFTFKYKRNTTQTKVESVQQMIKYTNAQSCSDTSECIGTIKRQVTVYSPFLVRASSSSALTPKCSLEGNTFSVRKTWQAQDFRSASQGHCIWAAGCMCLIVLSTGWTPPGFGLLPAPECPSSWSPIHPSSTCRRPPAGTAEPWQLLL